MMDKIVRINTRINMILGGFGILVCVGVVLLVVSDIVMRYFFNSPYTFSVEVTQIALVLIVFSFIPYSTSQLRHVSIEVLIERFSERSKFIISLAGDFWCVCVFLIICRQSFLEGLQAQMFGSMTGELEIPLYPFYFFVAFGALLSCISVIVNILVSIQQRRRPR